MRVDECCLPCLRGLAEKTVALSGGQKNLLPVCYALIEKLWNSQASPPSISNVLLKEIKRLTGVMDPYKASKEQEYREALAARKMIENVFGDGSLEGVLKLAAMGNSMDFFIQDSYSLEDFIFHADIAKIREAIYNNAKDVLILGDNVGDFIFDLPLASFLEDEGKKVYYAVRERPVQNDLSMEDVERFGFFGMWPSIISTGTDEVGVRKEDLRGVVQQLWESDTLVIAKGMGNYETMKDVEKRRVLHIMKVKCPAVAQKTGQRQGTYIAELGGE